LFGYEKIGSNSNGFVCVKYSPTQVEFFLDAPWKAARAFAIIANICSGMTLLCLLVSSCVAYPPIALQGLAGLSFFSGVSVILTFLLFASVVGDAPFNGSFYYGGAMTIIGCISCFITAMLLLQIQPPSSHNYVVREPTNASHNTTTRGSRPTDATNVVTPPKRNFPPAKRVVKPTIIPQESARDTADIEAFQPGTETITETQLPDGTRKLVTTVIGLDGSSTVTETIIRTD
jgi:hypothetical protein